MLKHSLKSRRLKKIEQLKRKLKIDLKTQSPTQLHTARTSVHTLRQRLYRSEMKYDLMYQENTELRSQMNDVKEEFSSKFAELEEKIELLISEVELARHERDILSECLDDL